MRGLAQLVHAGTHVAGGIADASDALVLVPASRAKRALERHLLACARDSGQVLIAPDVVTPAGLASRFVVPTARVLSPLVVRLAWRRALETSPEGVRAAFVPRGGELGPAVLDALARRIARLHADVTVACHGFEGVAAALRTALPDLDLSVWDALVSLECEWRAMLRGVGGVDAGTAALEACRSDGIRAGKVRRVLVLLADPEPLQREVLRALGAQGVPITVCVHDVGDALPAPIDVDGFPLHAPWSQARIAVPDDAIMLADAPIDQAAAVLDALQAMPRPVRSCDVTVSAPDPAVAAQAAALLPACGVRVHAAPTRTVAETPLGMLVAAVAAYVDARDAAALGTLVRHPDVERWLVAQGVSRPVAAVADFVSSRGIDRLPDDSFGIPCRRVAAVVAAVDGWLGPVRWAKDALHAVAALRAALEGVCGDRSPAGHDAAQAFRAAADDIVDVPIGFLAGMAPGAVARLILDSMESMQLPGEGDEAGVELVGWLEAGIDDAPHLVLTCMNEGQVPEGLVVDPWLPDSARARLGMPCARRRQARDAWILHSLLARKRSVRLVTGRTRADGEPMQPSRLLLGLDGESLARRMAWLADERSARSSVTAWVARTCAAGGFRVDLVPTVPARIRAVGVTSFRDWFKCPALFRLKHDPALRLRAAGEGSTGLDALGFGNLVHEALKRWGRAEASRTAAGQPGSTDAVAIEADVLAELDAVRREWYPPSLHGAYEVAIGLARERLRAFARVQAGWAAQGWRVERVELAFDVERRTDEPEPLPAPMIGSTGIALRGQIDRVDVNAAGERVALDYKTSADVETPEEHHRAVKGAWQDLQLPLYAMLLRSAGMRVRPDRLGYFVLPANPDGTAVLLASRWDQAFQDEAESEAERIAAEIEAGRFDADPDWKPPRDDEFEPVWGVGMRGLAEGGAA